MNYIEALILGSLEAVMYIMLSHGILGKGSKKWTVALGLIVINSILVALSDQYIDVPSLSHIICGVINCIFVVTYVKLIFKRKASFGIIMFFMMLFIALFIQILTVLVLKLIYLDFGYNFISGILSLTSSIMITYVLVKSQKLRLIEKYCSNKGYYRFKVTVTILLMAYYMVSIVWALDPSKLFESYLSITIVVILTILISNMLVKEHVLVNAYEDKITSYETYLKIIDDIIEEVRAKQHDYHNHIQTLVSLSESDNKATYEYASELVDGDIWRDLLALDNKILTALFYSKFKMAQERDIELKFDLKNNGFSSDYEIFEIVEMYGILLDNAIEASKRGDSIKVDMNRYMEKNRFEIANPHAFVSSNDIKQFFSKHYSTKSTAKRGIGLHKLRGNLLKKDDQIYFSYDSDIDHVVVRIEHT